MLSQLFLADNYSEARRRLKKTTEEEDGLTTDVERGRKRLPLSAYNENPIKRARIASSPDEEECDESITGLPVSYNYLIKNMKYVYTVFKATCKH